MPPSPATSSNRLGSPAAAAAVEGGHTSSSAAAPWQLPGLWMHLQQVAGEAGHREQAAWVPFLPADHSTRGVRLASRRDHSPDVGIGCEGVVAQVDSGHPDVHALLHKAAAVREGERPGNLLFGEAAAELLR